MNLFELSSNKKKFGIDFGTVVYWYDSRFCCEKSGFQFPAVAFSFYFNAVFKRRHEPFRVIEQQKETFGNDCGTVV